MARVAFVNMGYYRHWNGKKTFPEPVHLLPMHNICRAAGHTSQVFQWGLPGHDFLKEIIGFKPEVIALSYFGETQEMVESTHCLLKAFGRQMPKVFMGGPDIHDRSEYYAKTFSRYFRSHDQYLALTYERGEGLIKAFAQEDFDFDRAFGHTRGARVMARGTYIFGLYDHVPSAEQSFERPYDLALFSGEAYVKDMRGCWGQCFYCCNITHEIEARPVSSVIAEIELLVRAGVKKISLASANFTAEPARATEIVELLPPLEQGYDFETRVDSLYTAITTKPEAWREFAKRHNHIELGVECFLPERLFRLGKYPSLAAAQRQKEKLEYILEFFSGTLVQLNVFLMPLDWEMDLAEAEQEARQAQAYLAAYPLTVHIKPEEVGKNIVYSCGSKFSETMQPSDFYHFQRDSRLLFLSLIMRKALTQLKASYVDYGEFLGLVDKASTHYMLQYYFWCLEKIKPYQFKLPPLVKALGKGRSFAGVLNKMFRQIGWWRGMMLQMEMEQELFRYIRKNQSGEFASEFIARAITSRLNAEQLALLNQRIARDKVDKSEPVIAALVAEFERAAAASQPTGEQ